MKRLYTGSGGGDGGGGNDGPGGPNGPGSGTGSGSEGDSGGNPGDGNDGSDGGSSDGGGSQGGTSSGFTSVVKSDGALRSVDTIEAILGLCEGPIGGLYDGPRSFFLGDTPLVSTNGNHNFSNFILNTYTGDESSSKVSTYLGGTASNSSVGVNLSLDSPVTRQTKSTLRNQIDRLEIRLNFLQLYRVNSKGKQRVATANFKIQYRQVGNSTWLNFFSNETISLTGKTTAIYVKEYVKSVPRIDNDWEIRVERLDDASDSKHFIVYSWESFQTVTIEEKAYDGTALAHITGQASDQLSSVPQLSGIYRGRLVKVPANYDPKTRFYDETTAWDGVSWKLAFSDNPVWCLLDLLTNARFGLLSYYPQMVVDGFDFYVAAKFCDELVPRPGGTTFQPRYTYNDVITKARNGLEQIRYIAATFGGILYDDYSGVVHLIIDQSRTPVQIFGPESVEDSGFEYSFTDIATRANELTVSFINPLLDWNQDRRIVTDDEAIARHGRIPLDFVAIGCLDPHEATRRAQLRLISAQTEVTSVTFETARAGLIANIFDHILIADADMGWSQSSRVKAYMPNPIGDESPTIAVRDDLYLTPNTSFNIKLQTRSGLAELTVQNATDSFITRSLVSTEGSWPDDVPEFAQFTIEGSDNDTGFAKPFRILNIEKSVTNPEAFVVSAVEININKQTDADLVISTDSIDYSFRQTDRPFPPIKFDADSGTTQLLTAADGTIRPRIFVQWESDLRTFIENFSIQFKESNDDIWSGFIVEGKHAYINEVVEGASYDIRIRAINILGNRSEAAEIIAHTVVGKSEIPTDPVELVATQSDIGIVLSWTGITDLDLRHYEIRKGDDWDTGIVIGTSPLPQFTHVNVVEDPITYWIKAIDTLGNESTNATTVTHIASVPDQPVITAKIVDAYLDLTWTIPESTFPIKEYIVKRGATFESAIEINRIKGVNYQTPVNWLGSEIFYVIAVNSVGKESNVTSKEVLVIASGASVVSVEVIDNNVLLRWTSNPKTLPIARYEIRKGDVYATADVLPGVDATFTSLFEVVGGTYKYWITPIDTAGNFGVSSFKSALVNQPPDFILNAVNESDFTDGVLVNSVLDSEGDIVFGANTTETFEEHFRNNLWDTPQDQIQAGYPIYNQPSETTASYTEEFDYGTILKNSLVNVILTESLISATSMISIDIAYKRLTGDSWIEVIGQSQIFATDFQFVRIRINYTGNKTDIASFSSMTVRLDTKVKTDSGNGTASSSDSSGTTVDFGVNFIDVQSIVVTPKAITSIIAVYDFVDAPYPTSFDVYLYDNNGQRVNGDFSWTARGF